MSRGQTKILRSILKAWLFRMAESNLCSVAHTLLSLLRHGTSQTSTFIGQPSRRLPHGLPGIRSSSVSPDTASSGSISQCSSRIPRSCMHDTSTRAVSAKSKAYFQNFISSQYKVIPLLHYSIFHVLQRPLFSSVLLSLLPGLRREKGLVSTICACAT